MAIIPDAATWTGTVDGGTWTNHGAMTVTCTIDMLHGDALQSWLAANEPTTSGELVGILNELNGTGGVEMRKARIDYLGL